MFIHSLFLITLCENPPSIYNGKIEINRYFTYLKTSTQPTQFTSLFGYVLHKQAYMPMRCSDRVELFDGVSVRSKTC